MSGDTVTTDITYICNHCGGKNNGFPVFCLNKKTYCGRCYELSRDIPILAYVVGAVTGGLVFFLTDWGLMAAVPWAVLGVMLVDKLLYKKHYE